MRIVDPEETALETAKPNMEKSPLRKLPPEIRNYIYKLAMTEEATIIVEHKLGRPNLGLKCCMLVQGQRTPIRCLSLVKHVVNFNRIALSCTMPAITSSPTNAPLQS